MATTCSASPGKRVINVGSVGSVGSEGRSGGVGWGARYSFHYSWKRPGIRNLSVGDFLCVSLLGVAAPVRTAETQREREKESGRTEAPSYL